MRRRAGNWLISSGPTSGHRSRHGFHEHIEHIRFGSGTCTPSDSCWIAAIRFRNWSERSEGDHGDRHR